VIHKEDQNLVDEVICSRRSIRAFLPKAVKHEDICRILEVAARAPSGTNTQPWKVYVVQGECLKKLSQRLQSIYNNPEEYAKLNAEYEYYPTSWISPYIDRRRKVGFDLYQLLGLSKENKAGMHAQMGRNFQFFDAPVGLIFSIDRVMQQGSWLDYGMFLQNIMLAAQARGLASCPQAAFTIFHKDIADELGFPANEMLVCGMALGYADLEKVENTLVTERVDLNNFCRFLD
jgi:nitroreductase